MRLVDKMLSDLKEQNVDVIFLVKLGKSATETLSFLAKTSVTVMNAYRESRLLSGTSGSKKIETRLEMT